MHPGAASININKSLWKMYFHDLLPLFVASGDDGNYAQTAASDLSLLQVKISLKNYFRNMFMDEYMQNNAYD